MARRTKLCGLSIAVLLALPSGSSARQPHVVDGRPASIAHWPFIAALVTHGDAAADGQFCGGSVIAPSLVLTAAHCMDGFGPGDVDVVTGRASLSDDSAGQRTTVAAIRIDPSYDPKTQHHDAALLLLSQPTSAPPISLARLIDGGQTAPGAPLLVAGWGATDPAGNNPSDDLYAGAVKALATRRCADAYGSYVTGRLMVCAGSRRGHRTDACEGDSGGPLVSTLRGTPRLVGIVAFGGDVCADPGSPGVYTRAGIEIPWILRTLPRTRFGARLRQ